MAEYQTLLVEQRGPVTLVTLNRPEALNALNAQVLADLLAALGGAAAVAQVQALAGRIRVELREPRTVDAATLPGVRGVAQLTPTTVHLLV